MKHLMTALIGLLVLTSWSGADGAEYGWTISTSNTDPYANTGVATNGLRTVYLWYTCSTPEPAGPGGMASAVFRINSTSISHLATIPMNGFLNAGSTNDMLLAVGACPTGPVVAANLLILDLAGGSMCFSPSEIKPGLIGTVDCAADPDLYPMEWIGYSNTAGVPCSDGTATCVVADPVVADAGADAAVCEGVSAVIGGSPTGSGGTPPYTYSWSPAAGLDDPTLANPTATPGATTVYTVTVTDDVGGTAMDSMTLTVNPSPVADAGLDVGICDGSSTTIGGSPTGSGGTPPYTYSWSPAAGLDDPTLANPTASPAATTEYTVTVTDANGCEGTDAATVTVNPNPTADAGVDVAVCAGSSTTIGGSPTGSGGTAPYTYSWSPATGLDDATASNPTATPAVTTAYTVTVTDAAGCEATDEITVTVNETPSADAGADVAVCDGFSTVIGGSPTGSGGTPPYTYSWSPAAGLDDATLANPTATPAATTEYTVTVTDANGCEGTDAVTVTVNPNPVADAGLDQKILLSESVVIGGSPTGSGGTPPYTYSWSPAVGLDDPTLANPTASPGATSFYTVTVTDANGCEGTDEVTVEVNLPGDPIADAGPDVAICDGGSVVIGGDPTGSDGVPPYTYSWSPAAGLDDPTLANPTASPAATTEYTVTVTDDVGATSMDAMTLTVNPNPVADAGMDVAICDGSSVMIGGSPTGSGGTPPYSYSWSPTTGLDDPTLANPTASPAATTEYTVTVTDANGCEGTDAATVTVNPNPSADAGPDVKITEGESVVIGGSPTASGGTPPYTYSWTPAAGLDDPTLANPTASPVATTMYTVTVTDANGCEGTDAVTVSTNELLAVEAGADAAICDGESVVIGGAPTASGGTPPYSYSWFPAAGLDDPTLANPTASPAATTMYTVTVTDDVGVTAMDAVVVTVNPSPTADAGPDAAIDAGDSTPIGGSPTASGGTPPYTYSWSPAAGLDDPTLANPLASPAATTMYTVTVTDANGCEDSDAMTVSVAGDDLPCFGVATLDVKRDIDDDDEDTENNSLPGWDPEWNRLWNQVEIGGDGTDSDSDTDKSEVKLRASISFQDGFDPLTETIVLVVFDDEGEGVSIPIGPFEQDGNPGKMKFKFKENGPPKLDARINLKDCKLQIKAEKNLPALRDVSCCNVTVRVETSGGAGEETVFMEDKGKKLRYRASPEPDCCEPDAPSNLLFLSTTELAWTPPLNYDVEHFTIYGSNQSVLDGSATLIAIEYDPTGSILGADYDYYHVTCTDYAQNESGPASIARGATGVGDLGSAPAFALYGVSPNPARPPTSIEFELPVSSTVQLEILDIAGRSVRTLVSGTRSAGRGTVSWDGRDDHGRRLASGIYFYRIAAGSYRETKKLTLIR